MLPLPTLYQSPEKEGGKKGEKEGRKREEEDFDGLGGGAHKHTSPAAFLKIEVKST